MSIHDAQVMFVGVMLGFFGFMTVDLFLMRRARKLARKRLSEMSGRICVPGNNQMRRGYKKWK